MGTRPDITMRPDEVRAFLATQDRAVVVALADGAPVGTVGTLALVGETVEVTLAPDDPLVGLLRTDDRICVIAEEFPDYRGIKGVCAHGRAEALPGRDRPTWRVGLDDTTSFDFAKAPRT
jgi:hypothetical protein